MLAHSRLQVVAAIKEQGEGEEGEVMKSTGDDRIDGRIEVIDGKEARRCKL